MQPLSSETISSYLLDIGLCTPSDLESIQVKSAAPAKNFNLLVSFSDHRQLLVKQERPHNGGLINHEFFNEWQFHRWLQQFPDQHCLASSVSQILHFDPDHCILVYNYLNNYLDLFSFYYQNQVFPEAIATDIGTVVGNLHRVTFNQPECRNFLDQVPKGTSAYRFGNPAKGIGRLSPEMFGSIPNNALKFFVLYQRYPSLGNAIADLETDWHPSCLTHNDLKLNNILVHRDWEQFSTSSPPDQSMVRLIDWERCAWGDPAFDLGTIIASYLGIWLSSLVVDPTIKLEESLGLAVTPLQVLQPSIAALTQAYLTAFPGIESARPNWLKRVVQFTGLALIYQIQAMIYYQKSFDNTGICILQVAKSLLCRPKQSVPTVFGISESELISNPVIP
ncbi:phosphotransferase [Moorena sp. SIO3H5]|uniref:phosphotransferase n=1 Tax=Moorena sp. SIO3H5 TaxID=2607834 RepID=UPI0025D48FE9|nr:phosphotransferase [Moorena sp. SIO3H5]